MVDYMERKNELCDFIINEVEFWKSSNDINSPSHRCEIDTELINLRLFGVIDDCDVSELNILMNSLLDVIRRV